MVAAISTGGGALWLVAALFLMALVTIVIATGDSIDDLDDPILQAEPTTDAAGVDQRLTAFH